MSGLQVGNNVRFSGINVGTVDNITIINDSTVKVDLLVKKMYNSLSNRIAKWQSDRKV
ncbi:MAG: MCE family protein [Saprospiraceae bacterium]|nr:MCE family protein [Candidatus Brachybacter algidus]